MPIMSGMPLEHAEFLVVQDIFLTETAEYAHVVLPATSAAEKDGTFFQHRTPGFACPQGHRTDRRFRPDWEIIQEVSNRFGYPMEYESPSEIMDEIARLTPSYGGITYDRLEGEGLCWPCPTKDHPGTKFLHQGKFSRGNGLFQPIEYLPPDEVVDDEYPLWLTTGRAHVHYHTGTMTRNSPSLHAADARGIRRDQSERGGTIRYRPG